MQARYTCGNKLYDQFTEHSAPVGLLLHIETGANPRQILAGVSIYTRILQYTDEHLTHPVS